MCFLHSLFPKSSNTNPLWLSNLCPDISLDLFQPLTMDNSVFREILEFPSVVSFRKYDMFHMKSFTCEFIPGQCRLSRALRKQHSTPIWEEWIRLTISNLKDVGITTLSPLNSKQCCTVSSSRTSKYIIADAKHRICCSANRFELLPSFFAFVHH